MNLNIVEEFLLNLEMNERHVFEDCPEHLVLHIMPFFQLVHVINVDEIIVRLMLFESVFSGKLIRVEGYITLVVDEHMVSKEKMCYLINKLYGLMWF
ncbi:hypothetical protein [Citrobacter portucalensis]|uniref:hypothetical protein n=1 Tax=Citrobacter portucalensis TaxID=1639133 RepID=UPI00226B11FD|nr:hypothetical protein [Citrobacter portucalensis]MCX8986014.1 hypothetical protein [Citrobacter portucalensis]